VPAACPLLPALQAIDIDFTPPFRRISMCSGLEEALNVKLPADLDSEEARLFLVDLVRGDGVGVGVGVGSSLGWFWISFGSLACLGWFWVSFGSVRGQQGGFLVHLAR